MGPVPEARTGEGDCSTKLAPDFDPMPYTSNEFFADFRDNVTFGVLGAGSVVRGVTVGMFPDTFAGTLNESTGQYAFAGAALVDLEPR